MNLYSFNCSYIQKVCAFVVQSHLEHSIRISVYFSSENSLWAGFINPSLLTSPFSRIPYKCLASPLKCCALAILDWSTCGTSPNNGPVLCQGSFPTSSQPLLSKSPQSPHSCALRAQQFDNKSHSVRMGAQHQLCICYSSIINQADSFHVPMLFPGMLITWIPCDLCHNSRHIKCPVKYVHTYDQTRNFFLSIFLKGCQPTENWHVTFMAMKAVLGCLDFWLSLPFSMFSVTTCLCRSKCMYVFHSMLCTTCLAQKCYF